MTRLGDERLQVVTYMVEATGPGTMTDELSHGAGDVTPCRTLPALPWRVVCGLSTDGCRAARADHGSCLFQL